MPTYFHNADLNYLPVYPYQVVEDVFNQLATASNIQFSYPQGGCQQRAQLMSMMLTKNHAIQHCKVWLFAPVTLYDNDNRTLYIKDVNNLTNEEDIQWNYHVAPIVQVQLNGNIIPMVIDPSINYKAPHQLNDWFAGIGNSDISKYTFMLPDKYFFNCVYNNSNQITTIFDGSFYNYEEDDKNDLTLEKGLALNDVSITIFENYIQPDATNHSQRIYDLKEIFGNATAMDLLFAQKISGQTPQTKLRYALSNYPQIMHEAQQLFNERVVYWMGITNKLI